MIARHHYRSPMANLFIACLDPQTCEHCRQIPPSNLPLSKFLWDKWNGTLPNPMRDPLDPSRFLTFLDRCLHRQSELPSEFANWQKCLLCQRFFSETATDLQRHLHLVHPGSSLTELSAIPFLCSFRLPRLLNDDGIPFGPYEYCNKRFKTRKEIDDHKKQQVIRRFDRNLLVLPFYYLNICYHFKLT